jgi:hypothetical protein
VNSQYPGNLQSRVAFHYTTTNSVFQLTRQFFCERILAHGVEGWAVMPTEHSWLWDWRLWLLLALLFPFKVPWPFWLWLHWEDYRERKRDDERARKNQEYLEKRKARREAGDYDVP